MSKPCAFGTDSASGGCLSTYGAALWLWERGISFGHLGLGLESLPSKSEKPSDAAGDTDQMRKNLG